VLYSYVNLHNVYINTMCFGIQYYNIYISKIHIIYI